MGLSKYHIMQCGGSELIAKYPLRSPETPGINCLVEAPSGYRWGGTFNAEKRNLTGIPVEQGAMYRLLNPPACHHSQRSALCLLHKQEQN